MHPQTDIVIPVHNALEYIKPCIDSLFEKTKNFRLILVDDHSDIDTTTYLLGVLLRQPTALYVRTAQQKWFTRASNIGLRLARTRKTILLNSDCVLGDNWLQEMHDVWTEAEPRDKDGFKVGLVGSHQSDEEPRRWGEYTEPGYVTGHCLLLDIPILGAVADGRGTPGWYLDEAHQDAIHINSDRYLSYELNRMGFRTVASFKAAVGHHGGKSWDYNLARTARLRIGNPELGEVLG